MVLYKERDKTQAITALSHYYQKFSKVVSNRITNTLHENQPSELAGFRSGYSKIEHLQTVG